MVVESESHASASCFCSLLDFRSFYNSKNRDALFIQILSTSSLFIEAALDYSDMMVA
jgi:hypothetical protein